MAADQGIIDAVSTDNVKTVAGSGAWAIAQRQIDYVNHAKRVDVIAEKMLGDFINTPSQNLLDNAQIGEKVANTSPPETGIAQQMLNLSASLASVLGYLQAQANGPAPKP